MIWMLLIAGRATTRASVISSLAVKQHKVCFDLNICRNCLFWDICPARAGRRFRRFYFTHQDYMNRRRQQAIEQIPEQRQNLRANIEASPVEYLFHRASVRKFKHRMPHAKLRVRGLFQTRVFAFTTAVAINFQRVSQYIHKKPKKAILMALHGLEYAKEQTCLAINIFLKCLFNALNRKDKKMLIYLSPF